MSDLLATLATTLAAEGGLPAGTVGAPDGPEWGGRAPSAEHALVVELVREGYELHHAGRGRVVAPGDPDLALLAGDRLYAMGLARLAELGDVAAVAELADTIALSAAARAAGAEDLAEAIWEAGARAAGRPAHPAHAAAKDAARRGDPGAAAALRRVARQLV